MENHIETYERWDISAFNHIKELLLDPELDDKLNSIHLEPNVSRIRVMNSTKKGDPKGRLYANIVTRGKKNESRQRKETLKSSDTTPEPREEMEEEEETLKPSGTSLQGLNGWIRRILSYKYYLEYDIKNCGPTLLSQILGSFHFCPPELADYVNGGRERIFEKYKNIATKEEIKKAFLIALNLGSCDSRFVEIKKLRDGIQNALLSLSKVNQEYRELFQYCIQKVENTKSFQLLKTHEEKEMKRFGSFCAHVWMREERKILLAMRNFFATQGYNKSFVVLMFDGLLVEQSPLQKPIHLENLMKYVFDMTGFGVKIEEKSLEPTKEDWDKYNGEKSAMKLVTSPVSNAYNQRYAAIIREAQKYGYKRYQDYVMEKHPSIPGVYRQVQQQSGKYLDAKVFMNQVLSKYDSDLHNSCDMSRMVTWFKNNDHHHFEIIHQFQKEICSFKNCFLNIHDRTFTLWQNCKEVPITNWYFDVVIDVEHYLKSIEETPNWTKILTTQLVKTSLINEDGSEEEDDNAQLDKIDDIDDIVNCDDNGQENRDSTAKTGTKEGAYDKFNLFEILMGRLFYDVNQFDKWQVVPFITGPSDTGKSTIGDIVNEMRPPGSVKTITENFEPVFGLQSILNDNTSHIEIPELRPEWLPYRLNQSTFQSMSSGEMVSVPIKNNEAKIQVWKIPMFLRGNPSETGYKNEAGQIDKRLVTFHFDTLISRNRDTNLKRVIVENELVSIMIRCIWKYRDATEKYQKLGFWEAVAPKSMCTIGKISCHTTDDLSQMLENGFDNAASENVQFILEWNNDSNTIDYHKMTSLNEFNVQYKEYIDLKYKRKKFSPITSNNNTIKKFGYTFKQMNYCKKCKSPCVPKKKCCSDYDARNRGKSYYIQGMSINKLSKIKK